VIEYWSPSSELIHVTLTCTTSTNTLQIQALFFRLLQLFTGFPRILENGKYLRISFYTLSVGKCSWKLKKWSKSGIYPGNLYWKHNFLTTWRFDAIMDFFTCDWILIAIIGTNSCNIDLHYFYQHIADSDYQFVPMPFVLFN
jgi:hypothetical protein